MIVERRLGAGETRLGKLVRHHRGRLADERRLETDGKLEPAQFPIIAMANEYVLWGQISVDESADGVQIVQGLEDLVCVSFRFVQFPVPICSEA